MTLAVDSIYHSLDDRIQDDPYFNWSLASHTAGICVDQLLYKWHNEFIVYVKVALNKGGIKHRSW